MDWRYNKIIEEIYLILEEILKNMNIPSGEIDDLKQEIIIVILEYDKEKIMRMYENKQIKFFCVRIIQQQYFSKTSPYFKKYKKYYQFIDSNAINNEEQNDD